MQYKPVVQRRPKFVDVNYYATSCGSPEQSNLFAEQLAENTTERVTRTVETVVSDHSRSSNTVSRLDRVIGLTIPSLIAI